MPHWALFGIREKNLFKLDNFLGVIRDGKTNAGKKSKIRQCTDAWYPKGYPREQKFVSVVTFGTQRYEKVYAPNLGVPSVTTLTFYIGAFPDWWKNFLYHNHKRGFLPPPIKLNLPKIEEKNPKIRGAQILRSWCFYGYAGLLVF